MSLAAAVGRRFAAALAALVMTATASALAARAADPDALWHVVHDLCVPNERQHADPEPCAFVDLDNGPEGGYAILKDLVGATQYLLVPTARVTGIEDPQLLRPAAPNYFAAAWRERIYTEQAAGHALPRDGLSLAINSTFGRSQNQLHIHISCLRPEIRAALLRQKAVVGDVWSPLPAPLAGRTYRAMRVLGDGLDDADPFRLLAAGIPGGAAAMGMQTLVAAGAEFAGTPGFVLLTDRVDLAAGDRGHGEELQDHDCALARQ